MKNDTMAVWEKNGGLCYQGVIVNPGDWVKIDGTAWKVLGGGRSTGKSRAPFLWVSHERYGTSLFAPALVDTGPHKAPRPVEKKFVPVLEVANFPDIASLARAWISPEKWARFKREFAV